MAYSLRLTYLGGDLDSQRDIYLVGPYPDAATLNAATSRFWDYRTLGQDWEAQESSLDPATGGYDRVITPAELAAVSTSEELEQLIFQYSDELLGHVADLYPSADG